jgi:hypothetical protein
LPQYAPVIATLFAAAFGGWLLVRVHRRNAQRTAAVKFRGAFAVALATIEAAVRHDSMDPHRPKVSELLRDSFVNHAAAVEEYKPFVPTKRRLAYQRTWQQYKELAYDAAGVSAEFLAEHRDEDAPLTVIKNRIHAVLTFAET